MAEFGEKLKTARTEKGSHSRHLQTSYLSPDKLYLVGRAVLDIQI